MAHGVGVKVHADASELAEAESKLAHFAEHFEHHFLRHLSRAIGPMALIAGAFKLFEGAFEKTEKIEEFAKKFKLTTDEVQLATEAFKEMGMTFEEGMSKAEKGAINLVELINKMRASGKGGIINHEDIEQVTQDLKLLKGHWDSTQNAIIHGTATVLRNVENSNNSDRTAAFMHGMSDAMRGKNFTPPAPSKGGSEGAGGEGGGLGVLGFGMIGSFLPSPGLMRLEAIRQLKAQLASLKDQKAGLPQPETHGEIINNNLSGFQQIGGYSSQQGEIESKLDEVKDASHEIAAKIDETNRQLEKLSQD